MSKGKNSQPGQSPASRRRWSPEYSGTRTSRRCEGLTFRVSVPVTSAVPTVCRGLDRPSPAPSTVISDSPGTVTLTLSRSWRGTWLCRGSRACPHLLSTSDGPPAGPAREDTSPALPSGASAGGTAANTQGRVASAWPRAPAPRWPLPARALLPCLSFPICERPETSACLPRWPEG